MGTQSILCQSVFQVSKTALLLPKLHPPHPPGSLQTLLWNGTLWKLPAPPLNRMGRPRSGSKKKSLFLSPWIRDPHSFFFHLPLSLADPGVEGDSKRAPARNSSSGSRRVPPLCPVPQAAPCHTGTKHWAGESTCCHYCLQLCLGQEQLWNPALAHNSRDNISSGCGGRGNGRGEDMLLMTEGKKGDSRTALRTVASTAWSKRQLWWCRCISWTCPR